MARRGGGKVGCGASGSHAAHCVNGMRANPHLVMPSAKLTKMELRNFIMTATARSTEPVGPCSASRWPQTVANEAMQTVYKANVIVIAPQT